MINKLKKVIITAGGTGGHIFPAYSLAKHFINKGIEVEIVSDKRGLRYLKNYKDINITQIASSTIFKKNIIQLLLSFIIIFYSILRSLFLLLIHKPNLVFGMGGYSSFPVCIAAKILNIPFIVYENNLHIGKANRYLLPYAKKVFVSFEELEGIDNKYKSKVCRIGNIIRDEILNYRNKSNFDQNNKKLRILILGGSQAAKIFAEQLPKIFEQCSKAQIPLVIFQQCLPYQNEFLEKFYKKLNIDHEIFNFSNNIIDYFSKINVAITRSGSSMQAELINSLIPFVSVPLPTSADNHQLKNAIYYQKNGYSYLIEEKDLSTKLFKLIKLIHEDKSLLEKMRNKQSQYSDNSVYENIDEEIDKLINEKY